MNEQAIKDMYQIATANGYTKSEQEFKQLIQSNEQALKDMYSLASQNGYSKPITDFEQLVGFKKKVDSEPGSVESSVDVPAEGKRATGIPSLTEETPKEKKYFGGFFGDFLKNMDSPMNPAGYLGFGNFIDDVGRAVATGIKTGAIVSPANEILLTGPGSDSETINKLIERAKSNQDLGFSDEFMSFSKDYEEGGGDIIAMLKAMAKNPGALPDIIVQSLATMINPSSIAATGTVVGGAAGAGSLFAGVGAAPAALASLPYAMGAANVVMETGLTFSELLQDEINRKNLNFDEAGVRSVLEDDEALKRIRVGSVARGATIGIIDAITGRVAGKVGVKLLGNSAASKIKSGLATSTIEAAGGSAGEAAGRLAAGQEMDEGEILLEGIVEVPMGGVSLAAELGKVPTYKVNGARVSESDIKDLIENSTAEQLLSMNIDIKNDKAGYMDLIQDKIETGQIESEIRSVNPNLDDEQVSNLTKLEKELRSLEGKKTQTAKDRAAQIKEQIKLIEETATAPKAEPASYSIDGVTMDREKTLAAIEGADSIESLDEIQISNDKELEKALEAKKELALKIQRELMSEVFKIAKSSLSLEYISGKDLVSSKNPIGNKAKQEQIKEKQKNIIKLINCLQSP